MQSRRSFIKTSCTACTAIFAGGFIVASLSSCGTALPLIKSRVENKQISVPLDSFNSKSKIIIVRGSNLNSDILLIKISETEYRALLMQCTHRDNLLTANDKGLYCPAHGSAFDLSGNVTKEPAQKPLKKFNTTVTASHIIIELNT